MPAANADDPVASADEPPVLEVTSDISLDPQQTYGSIVVRKSGITIDGGGAWLIGTIDTAAAKFKGTAIS